MTDLAALEDWHFWFVGRDQLVGALLARHAPTGTVVDVGCGTGGFAARLDAAADGRTVVAVDRLPPGRAGAAPAIAGDVERLPLRSASVDVALARDVLEHVNDSVALDEIRRVLRPSGVLIALVPAWPRLWSARDVRAGHLRRYTRRTLAAVLARRGFDVVEVRGYQAVLLPALAVSRAAARLRPERALRSEEAPPPALNALLRRLNGFEANLARSGSRWSRPPTGSTLAVVARST